ncbi:hypothetical protein ACGFS9_27030 [Streptomyces sp. NPDC048566]|uniref:hypothetical protein n=1 Tax=Streptomyces sp. NPDC048566 TaxID=3365569 RepID=UPI003718893D
MPDRLAFHESFDSTRATADHPDDHPNLAQAQAEAVVSLLMGRSLSVNNTYAFDSRGMLDLADVVLETWERAKQGLSRTPRARLAGARPFVLHRFRQPTFLAACSDQLRRSDPEARNFFKLSTWQPVDRLPAVRHAFAASLDRLASDGGAHHVPAEIRDHAQLARHLDVLLRLNDYFEGSAEYDRSREARVPQTSVKGYVQHLLDMPADRVSEVAAGHGCPADTALRLQTAVRAKAEETAGPDRQVDAGVVNRGWVHGSGGLDGRDPLLDDQLRELVDTLYNAVMAESACARFEYMSSVPRMDGRDELKHVNSLAMALIQDTVPSEGEQRETHQRSPRMAGMFAAAETVPNLSSAPLRQVFEAYWALMADEERWFAWQDSCAELDRLVRLNRPVDEELREAWESHLAQLQASLPHVVTVERSRLAIPVGADDGRHVQTMALGSLSEADLDRSFAAGEYLGDLARSLGTAGRHGG